MAFAHIAPARAVQTGAGQSHPGFLARLTAALVKSRRQQAGHEVARSLGRSGRAHLAVLDGEGAPRSTSILRSIAALPGVVREARALQAELGARFPMTEDGAQIGGGARPGGPSGKPSASLVSLLQEVQALRASLYTRYPMVDA